MGGLKVIATRTQQGTICIVAVTMVLDGSPGASAYVGAAAAVAFGLGTLGAGIKKKGK